MSRRDQALQAISESAQRRLTHRQRPRPATEQYQNVTANASGRTSAGKRVGRSRTFHAEPFSEDLRDPPAAERTAADEKLPAQSSLSRRLLAVSGGIRCRRLRDPTRGGLTARRKDRRPGTEFWKFVHGKSLRSGIGPSARAQPELIHEFSPSHHRRPRGRCRVDISSLVRSVASRRRRVVTDEGDARGTDRQELRPGRPSAAPIQIAQASSSRASAISPTASTPPPLG